LRALVLLVCAASAQGEVLVGARVGALVPQPFSTLDSSYVVGIEAGWVAPVWKHRLALAADLSFTAPDGEGQFQSTSVIAPVSWRASVRQVMIGVQLMVRQPVGRFMPYLAAGPRVLIVDALVTSQAGDVRLPGNRESAAALGVQIVPGLGFSLGPGQLFLELPCAFLWRVGAAPQLTGDFNPSSLTVAAGYRVFF
jgi:hypothetical protein